MRVKQHVKEDVVICSIEGEINIDNADQLRDVFRRIIEGNARKVILDFGAVDYIDSSGLTALIDFIKNLKMIEGNMFLADVPPKIDSIFTITKLNKIFKIVQTQEQALEKFSGYEM